MKSFFKLFFHIRNPLSFFFLTGRQKNEEDEEEEEEEEGFFLHFFRCDAFVFLCVLRVRRGIFVFFGSNSSSLEQNKQTKKKE